MTYAETHGSTITALGFGRDAMNRVQNHKEGGIGSCTTAISMLTKINGSGSRGQQDPGAGGGHRVDSNVVRLAGKLFKTNC